MIRFLRKLKWVLQGKCIKCGHDTVQFGYYSSSCVCPKCGLV